jgi:glycosyltransferase involved in cell wall biosynthesis
MEHLMLTIVVPCYNEESVLAETTSRLLKEVKAMEQVQAQILFVDDGSHDRTWCLIREQSVLHPEIHGIKLAHNAGHQRALWAGLEWAVDKSDAIISIDADLQDDVGVMSEMVERFQAGADVVFGVRRERATDSFFKKHSAQLFYKLISNFGGEIVYNHADYRLLSKRALKALLSYPERNLFLRGMVCTLGFPQEKVYYDRAERFAGESKYPLGKMVNFALDGITSFSVRPLRYIVGAGLMFILVALLAIVYGLTSFMSGNALPGWTSLLVSLWFIGGAILTAIGIIGEYVGKIYNEVKQRPRYFVEDEV